MKIRATVRPDQRGGWLLDVWHRGRRYRVRRDSAGRLDSKARADALRSEVVERAVSMSIPYAIAPYIARRHAKLRALPELEQRWHRRCRSQLLRSARRRAAQKGVPCTITAADIEIPERCPALGIELVPTIRGQGFSKRDNSPSIDRLDHARGYVPGNVAVISWRANKLRSNATAVELNLVTEWAAYAEVYCRTIAASEELEQSTCRRD